MNDLADQFVARDQAVVWHPYSAMDAGMPVFPVKSAEGVRIKLMDGRELIDGMSSWWCAIHGYNHPQLNQAIHQQVATMSHVMFGGLTHEPAITLAEQLLALSGDVFCSVFFADSGSVAVEVAIKMAIQYWIASNQPGKQKILSIRHGYHGDTFAAMSVSDPENGMHHIFERALLKQFIVDGPVSCFGEPCHESELEPVKQVLVDSADQIAAIILEPIVQGAGGMRFYSAQYLTGIRRLCDEFNVLLILDEIATGFGRTGRMFASEYSQVTADILCLGKALTGGYMSFAAVLTNEQVAGTISNGEPGLFMHGPTFMGNPLACQVSLASLDLLLKSAWQDRIQTIEAELKLGLQPCSEYNYVKDVRVLGAIGVVELGFSVDIRKLQPQFVDAGVWVRPFNHLIYVMPPYIINQEDLHYLTRTICTIVSNFQEPT